MRVKRYSLHDEQVQFLMKSDKALGDLIRTLKVVDVAIEEDGFKCLVKYIIGQQISDKARETIWERMNIELASIDPEVIVGLPNLNVLCAVGISWRKAECIRMLAENILNNKIDFKQFSTHSNEQIIKRLIEVKGIGKWTAEMYLIFSLGRENVVSSGDGTIKRVLQWMYGLKKIPTSLEVNERFSCWQDYASIVSAYFWYANALGLTKIPFSEAILGRRAEESYD